ncbi:MAG: magnesium transporter [Gammaproteobacteria bacterium]|nr:magnesium transporter [Gammaproteobacteria bacterium]MBL7000141.1 magnesium transporter [Gammaproteobacteria bacterium]
MPDLITENLRQDISSALEQSDSSAIAQILDRINIAQIADILDSTPSSQREQIWPQVYPFNLGPVLLETSDEVRQQKLKKFSSKQIAEIIDTLPDVDDQADLMLSLPAEKLVSVLFILDQQKREKLESVLAYPEDTAGGLMDLNPITIRADVTLDVVLRYLRIRGELPAHTDQLFVTDRYDKLIGTLSLSRLLTSDTEIRVEQVMNIDILPLQAQLIDDDVARIFEDNDLISAAVVDENGRLLGRITIDDVVDVIREEGDNSVLSMAGLHEDEDLFSPIWSSSRRRAVWLGFNLLTAFLAASVIGLFENALDKIVALAILLTIVPSMGGIAGSQTLTLVIRGLALGQLGSSNFNSLVKKEITVGLINGLLWAAVVAAFTILWFEDFNLAWIIALSLVINLLAGAYAGAIIPVLLKRIGVDPALAGSVVLTTFTDVIGILAFLGMATLFLL